MSKKHKLKRIDNMTDFGIRKYIKEKGYEMFIRYKYPAITIATFGGAIYSIWSYGCHCISKSLTIPTCVVETEKSKRYIYLDKEVSERYSCEHSGRHLSMQTRQYIKDIFPAPIARMILWADESPTNLAEEYVSPWTVLRDAYSRNKKIRIRAVETIAAYKAWNDETKQIQKRAKRIRLEELLSAVEIEEYNLDAEIRTLAQSIDQHTAVGLARTHGVDLRLFLPPPSLTPLDAEEEIEDLLRELLISLPQTEVEQCIQYFTAGAITKTDIQKKNRGGLWCFGGNGLRYSRNIAPQDEVEMFCLQAIAKHSKFEDHCKVMVDGGILQLLQRIKSIRPLCFKIQENIVKIVSNICVFEQFHQQIYQSGWISLLAELSQSDEVALRVQASRGLANLDREVVKEQFLDGVYVLYPKYRSNLKPEADVVFVHGLVGGAFYSWRRSDMVTSDYEDKIKCWPESWLPLDLPGHRIMCVDYDTYISEWMSMCPHELDKRTISYRSGQLLDSLVKAGVGDRPIVWVSHSMGGLIVKRMLLDAKENTKKYGKVLKKTKGLIFFSTPHQGSQLAKTSHKARSLLFPSVEVMELSQDSPQLAELNEFLKELVEKNNIQVLSFGETQSTNIGLGQLLKLHIVPPHSANPEVGEFILADTNHLNVSKPTSRQSSIYQQTLNFIRDLTCRIEERDNEFICESSFLDF